MEPFRDRHFTCPSCHALLREHATRLVCDTCNGIMLDVEDLKKAIEELVGLPPTLEYKDEEPGARPCPRCESVMTTLKLRVVISDELAKPRPRFDRCEHHGIWCDDGELAVLFEKVHAKVSPHGARGDVSGWSGPGLIKWKPRR